MEIRSISSYTVLLYASLMLVFAYWLINRPLKFFLSPQPYTVLEKNMIHESIMMSKEYANLVCLFLPHQAF